MADLSAGLPAVHAAFYLFRAAGWSRQLDIGHMSVAPVYGARVPESVSGALAHLQPGTCYGL